MAIEFSADDLRGALLIAFGATGYEEDAAELAEAYLPTAQNYAASAVEGEYADVAALATHVAESAMHSTAG
ncbi:MAG: hypothetical protein ACT4OY_07700 [Alphaproteobacteria bacterium]